MSSASPNSQQHTFSLGRVLLIVVPVCAIAGAWYWVSTWKYQAEANQKAPMLVPTPTPTELATNHLDSIYTDADGDLVADTPTDPAKIITPDVIEFSYVAGPDADEETKPWKSFTEYLSKQIGKPVDSVMFKSTRAQLDALRDGKLQVTWFNTGTVPLAVNTAGFVPLCTWGKADGTFGSAMVFIVPAASNIQSMKDLKGHTITFTDSSSNSGFKAAVLRLRDLGLRWEEPDPDYGWAFSHGHKESIMGVAAGTIEAAPVNAELLDRAILGGDVKWDQIRKIDESKPFPEAACGVEYNLSPELRKKILDAMLAYSWAGTDLEKDLGASGAVKFVPVSYKNDFESIRRINDSIPTMPEPVEEENN